jgi:DNA-binding IclR family transcriptional regulator
MTAPQNSYFSKTFEKGIVVLSLFDRDHTRRSLSEISGLAGINKTSTYRLVNTMVTMGLLSKNPRSKTLRLGPKALMLGHKAIQGFELLHMTKPLIDEAFRVYNVTIDSTLLDGLTLLALYRREATSTLFFRQPLASGDLHARAMGKAVLSRLSKEDLDSFLDRAPFKKFTPKTVVSKESLIEELNIIRSRGYAINNEEHMKGLICIGSAIVNYRTHKVAGAISFDLPAGEFSVESVENNYAGPMTKLAHDLSEIVTMDEY